MNENDIKESLKKHYGLDVNCISKVKRGSAELFYIFSNQGEFVLKKFKKNFDTNRLIKEIRIIEHLKNKEYPVPQFLLTLDKKYYFYKDEYLCYVQKRINGYTISDNKATDNQLFECIDLYVKIVQSLEEIDIELPLNDSYMYENLNIVKAIESHKNLLSKINNRFVKKIILKKIELLSKIDLQSLKDIDNITYKNSHGDFTIFQFIYDNKTNKVCAVLDYVSAKKLPVVWEIFRSFIFADKTSKKKVNIDKLVKYITRFNEKIELNYFDFKYMPYVYYLYILRSVYGYEEFSKNKNKKIKKVIKSLFKQCVYLSKNAEHISNSISDKLAFKKI